MRVFDLLETETITAWTNITALPEPQRTVALRAFDKLAQDQRGEPERMGGGDLANPGMHHSSLYATLTEHVGDLINRMAKGWHVEKADCGADYVRTKGSMALQRMGSGHGYAWEIEDQLRRNYEHHRERGRAPATLREFIQEIRDAGRRYADAHAKLVVFNEAQFHASEAAISLGRQDFPGCVAHLKILVTKAKDPEAFGQWAALARVTSNGTPLPYDDDNHSLISTAGLHRA